MLLFYLQYNKGAGGSRQGQLTGSGGNRRLLLASLHNRDFVVWTGHFVFLLSLIGGWGGVLPPHFGRKKAGDLFQISCSVCRYVGGGYLIVKVRGKLTRCEADKLELIYFVCKSSRKKIPSVRLINISLSLIT